MRQRPAIKCIWPSNEGNQIWQDAPLRGVNDAYADWVEHVEDRPDWDRERWQHQIDQLTRHIALIDAGDREWDDEFEQLSAPLQLLRPLLCDTRVSPDGAAPASLAQIARVATDYLPDAGDRPDWVLGPWFEELDHRPSHRRALLIALAGHCFMSSGGDRTRALQRWVVNKPQPKQAVRATLRAVDHTPWSLWAVKERVGERWLLSDMVGLSDAWLPKGPVIVDSPGAVTGGLEVGGTLCARVVIHDDGPTAMLGLALPGQPTPELVARWVRLDAARCRLVTQRVRLETMLRRRGHVLVRNAHCWAWSQANPI